MDDIDDIKNRIYKRKNKVLKDCHFNRFYNFMIKMMVMLALVISVGSFVKYSPNINIVHTFLDDIIGRLEANDFINPNNTIDENVEVVKNDLYVHLEGNFYTNHSNEGISLMDGVVVESGKAEILGNYITVLNDDIKVTYGCLDELFVNQYDEIIKDMVIGTYSDKIMIIFSKGDKEIDYSTFEELSE